SDIGRYCALAYAALTTRYGDNILYAWQRRRIGGRLLRRLGPCWRLLFAAHLYLHRPNAGKSTEGLCHCLLYFGGHLLLIGGHLYHDFDILPLDLHTFDQPKRDNITCIAWIFHRF